MRFTRHAVVRAQQRGIRRDTIRVLLTYGEHQSRNGAVIVSMDHGSRSEAASEVGCEYGRVADRLNVYAVVVDGNVVTVAHRLQRRNWRRRRSRGRGRYRDSPVRWRMTIGSY